MHGGGDRSILWAIGIGRISRAIEHGPICVLFAALCVHLRFNSYLRQTRWTPNGPRRGALNRERDVRRTGRCAITRTYGANTKTPDFRPDISDATYPDNLRSTPWRLPDSLVVRPSHFAFHL
jgi:hypothetical protein